MKFLLFSKIFIFISLLFLSACTLPKKQEIIIDGNLYEDKNPPSVVIEFPFKIQLIENKITHSENERFEVASLFTDYQGIIVYIKKSNLNSRFYYTGVDLPLRDNRIYEYGIKNNSTCSVYIGEFNSIKFLYGEVIKHIDITRINQILLVKRIGAMSDHYVDQWKIDNRKELDEFIEKLKFVCQNYIG